MPYDVGLVDNDLPHFCEFISGDDQIRQAMEIRLRTHRGEWILDANVGMPYQDSRAKKPFNTLAFQALVRKELSEIDGVSTVQLSAEFDVQTQQVTVSGQVGLSNGDNFGIAVNPWTITSNSSPVVT